MAKILVGTASWTDRSLIDSARFYPPTVKTAEERLRYYASQFRLVEVDSSYYALPSAQNSALWTARTPPDFLFNVKAFRLFTQHQTPPAALPNDIREVLEPIGKKNLYYRDLPEELLDELWERFLLALRPLRDSGKLGVLVFQFPPWFVCRESNLAHILMCQRAVEGLPLAVEFRNKSWFEEKHREAVFEFERRHGLAHVVADEPQGFPSSIPALWEATARTAVVRLHGRNAETWDVKGLSSAAERFNYLYSEDELAELAGRIRSLAGHAEQVHVLFNNHYADYAQRNAGSLMKRLGE